MANTTTEQTYGTKAGPSSQITGVPYCCTWYGTTIESYLIIKRRYATSAKQTLFCEIDLTGLHN
jgi:hypothetical protein